MQPVQLYAWHFMSYPYLPPDFDEQYDSAWVTVPNALWDHERTRGLYQEYIDQLAYADELGFDGVVLNEHHQNAYGLMPEPNIIAAALTQRTKRCKIAVIGNLIPIRLNPMQIAEEYAMLDSISGGRMICGFVVGGPQEAFNFDLPAPQARLQFWEGVDLIRRAWTEPGPFAHEGAYYPLRYVNPWPLPEQRPHPPIWIPGCVQPRDGRGNRQARLQLLSLDAVQRRGGGGGVEPVQGRSGASRSALPSGPLRRADLRLRLR